jgi:hypothetical protein
VAHVDSTAPEVRLLGLVKHPGYLVGDDGSVWSVIAFKRKDIVRYGEMRRLKPTAQKRGHLMLMLGRGTYRFVHRLVLEAFVGPCPRGCECRHIDGNPANNRIGNLAWGSRHQNQADSVRHGTAYHRRKDFRERCQELCTGRPVGSGHKLTTEQVGVIRMLILPWERSQIIPILAEKFGVSKGYIRMIANGSRRPAGA